MTEKLLKAAFIAAAIVSALYLAAYLICPCGYYASIGG